MFPTLPSDNSKPVVSLHLVKSTEFSLVTNIMGNLTIKKE